MGTWLGVPIKMDISSSLLANQPIQGPMTPKLARTGQHLVTTLGHDQLLCRHSLWLKGLTDAVNRFTCVKCDVSLIKA